jgi:putative ABC transport system permease protein
MPKPSNPEFLKDPMMLEPAGAGTSALRQRFERPLVMMFGIVALVLFIACANIANLQLARGLARRHELSVRLALGASRWRLARQLLTESLVMAILGATAGLAFATWANHALVAQLSTFATPVVLDLAVDWRVLTFTATAMVATALLFGLAPALRATRAAPIDPLKEQGRTASEGRAALSSGLLVMQVALSLTLVVAAGLFVRTFEQLGRVTLGFDRDRVLVATVNAQLVSERDRIRLYHQLVQAAAAVPGVAHAGGSINPPLVGTLFGDVVVSPPGTPPPPDAQRVSQINQITPGWLSAYGTAIRAGRDIDDHDTASTSGVMVVNEAFVRRLFPDRNVVGTTLAVTARLPPNGDFLIGSKTVVGIVSDAVYRSIRDPVQPTIYIPLAQWGDNALPYTTFFIAVQSSTAFPLRLTRSVAAALLAVNPDVSLTFRSLADQVNDSLVQDRLIAMLSGFFGGLALLLAGLGLYGVTAYAVARRRTEIAIRMALGVAPTGVVRLVLSRVALLVGVGVLFGATVSLWASRLVATLLYGLQPRDPMTLIGSAFVLTTVAAVAAGLPAWRASRIDPAVVLRES